MLPRVQCERPAAELLTESEFQRLTGAPVRQRDATLNLNLEGLHYYKMSTKLALLTLVLTLALCVAAVAQAGGAQSTPAQKAMGTIKSISANTIILSADGGSEIKVQVQDATRLLRAVPGASLKDATPISIQDLRPGDRILVHGNSGDNQSLAARLVVAMTRADIAQKHQQDLQQWQHNGVGGLVKASDPAAGTVTLSTMTAAGAKDIVVKIAKSTIVRRYAPDSVKFDDAKPGTLDQIHPGDQLRSWNQECRRHRTRRRRSRLRHLPQRCRPYYVRRLCQEQYYGQRSRDQETGSCSGYRQLADAPATAICRPAPRHALEGWRPGKRCSSRTSR